MDRAISVTGALCDKIVATQFESLTPEAISAAKRLVLDGLAVAVAGSHERAITILADYYQEQGAKPIAAVLGFDFRTSPVMAAALNGSAMHVLDFEPMWTPSNHALSTTLPAILALTESHSVNGRDIITALVKGCEIQGLIRYASHQLEFKAVQFHPPGLVGPMSSAVAAAHILKLDQSQLANALGIASSRTGAVLGNIGTMTKSTHCGQAAALGLESALLAERGFTGNPETFDAPQGYAKTFFGETFQSDDLLTFGPPYRIVKPGYALKMFPSQYGTHFVITAGLNIRNKIPSPDAIRSVHLLCANTPYTNRPRPTSGLDGKFSFQYTLACALLDGRVGIDTFTDEAVQRPAIQDLLGKITVEMSPDIPARFDSLHVEVTITLTDGTTLYTRCDGPLGSWRAEPVTDDAFFAKARDCLSTRFDSQAVERVVELAADLERLDATGVRELIGIVAKSR
jgi:2-methylcitrate dehydratase PrpD